MVLKAAQSVSRSPKTSKVRSPVTLGGKSKLDEILSLAKTRGLLAGGRTRIVRGRMPAELVAQAKHRTGISSDSKLLEAALASVALADDYADWLISNRGTVSQDLDLEF